MKNPFITCLLVTVAALAARPNPADATCVDPASELPIKTSVKLGVTALSPPGPHPTLGRTIVASGSALTVLNTNLWTSEGSVALAGTVQNSPNPVRMDDSSYAVFVSALNGTIYRVNPLTRTIAWSKVLRRAACASDTLTATPSVHLRRFASDAFKLQYEHDVVYIGTRYSTCANSSITNKVYALDAETGTILWTFNEDESLQMDIVSQGGYVDYTADRLYVASDRTFAAGQHSVWSIDILTGTKAWSTSAGRIQVTPIISGSRMYVGTMTGDVKALNTTDGTVLWTVSVGLTSISNNIFTEFREGFAGLIGVVGADGRVRVVRDNGGTGTETWDMPLITGKKAKSRVAIDPMSGKLYVGADDGLIYQLNLTTGVSEATRRVDSTLAAVVGDMSFVNEGGQINMMAGSSAGTVAKFCGPWATENPGTIGAAVSDDFFSAATMCTLATDCNAFGAPPQCSQWACVGGVCSAKPVANGTVCNDNVACSTVDRCSSGVCTSATQCETSPGLCRCLDLNPVNLVCENYTRVLSAEHSVADVTNHCVGIAGNARSIAWVHLVDERGRPVTGSQVTFQFLGTGDMPVWRDPTSDAPVGGQIASIANRIAVEAGRPGSYFAKYSAPATGRPNPLITMRVTASKTDALGNVCDMGRVVLNVPVRIEEGSGASEESLSGCDFDSDDDEAGFLKVRVRYPDPDSGVLKDASGAQVMIGYLPKALAFHSDYNRYITGLPPDLPNFQIAPATGIVEFRDHSNELNGPFTLTAGMGSIKDLAGNTVEYATVTIYDLAATETVVVLPIARKQNGTSLWSNNGVGNRLQPSTASLTRMSLVSQSRDLAFYSGMAPMDLFDGNQCADGNFVAENAYIAPSLTPPPNEKRWNKTFNKTPSDTLQTSYLRVGKSAWDFGGAFNLLGWLTGAAYEQLGFEFNQNLMNPVSSFVLRLGSGTLRSNLTMSIVGEPTDADILGLTLTDYSANIDLINPQGRGAGKMFMQAHGFMTHTAIDSARTFGQASVVVPFWDLDDNSYPEPASNPMNNAATWNIGAEEALYVMNPPCGQAGQDARCTAPGMTPAMRRGRSTSLVRTGPGCVEPFDTVSAARAPGNFLPMLDVEFVPFQGGLLKACAGESASGDCSSIRQEVGDMIKHTIYLREDAYKPETTCGTGRERQKYSMRYPYRVLYSPGARAFLPLVQTPPSFPYGCGSVGQASCATNQRPGLPVRAGSQLPCALCTAGETCQDLNGVSSCVVTSGADYLVRHYEWKSEFYQVGLTNDPCRAATACNEGSKPADIAGSGSFDGAFRFSEIDDCSTKISVNGMDVD